MNMYGNFVAAKEDAVGYLYPRGTVENDTHPPPHADSQVHELLVNFILPNLEKKSSKTSVNVVAYVMSM
jgi:hypothetical protein